LLKNANENDIYHINEKLFMITNTQNFKNNANISINNINPSFDNMNNLKFNTNKIKMHSKNIYSDLSKYLKHPSNELYNNYTTNNNQQLTDKNENGGNINLSNTILKSLMSPGKLKLDPIKKNSIFYNLENSIINNKVSVPYYTSNNYVEENENSKSNNDHLVKLNKVQINKKNFKRNIKNSEEQKQSLIYMPRNLKLKKHPEHPFNKYIKNNQNIAPENNEFLGNSRIEHSFISDKSNSNEEEFKLHNTKIHKKIEKNNFHNIELKKNKLKPIAISNETAIKNISNLVYELMEKNNVAQSINNLFDSHSNKFYYP